ncbi:MAG: hypothetical protein QOE93_2258, partial [Actinomycetota bacterium]|nr:hypothetical protein [Actinomycetota bacterium]
MRPMRRVGALAVVVAGCAALLARPWLVRLPVDPVAILVVLFVVLGVVGATWPHPEDELLRPNAPGGRQERTERMVLPTWLVLGVGLGAFAVGRLLAFGALPPAPLVVRSLALNSLAAVSEEAFFRRFAYGLASGWGPVVAVGSWG